MFLFALCPIASARVSVKIVSETPKSQPGADFQFAPGELPVRAGRTPSSHGANFLGFPSPFPDTSKMESFARSESYESALSNE